jgi:hypothetical protein
MDTPMIDYDWDRLAGLGFTEEATGSLKEACWEGYTAIGMKTKNGRKVPNCVKVKKDADHNEGDIATAEMTPNYLPKEPGTGPAKNPQMGEQKIRMPRMPEINKANAKDRNLAMAAAPNYAETEDYDEGFYSDEPNGRMIVNQLRVIREKTDTLLGMLDGTENLPPWCFVKITNAGTGLASVADYLKYGDEFV